MARWLVRLAESPWNYWLGFGIDATVATAAMTAGAHARGASWEGTALALGAAALGTSFLEYAVHRWWYHRRAGLAAAVHRAHHDAPRALFGAPFFFPSALAAGIGAAAWPLVGGATSLLISGAALATYCWQAFVHHRAHGWSRGGGGNAPAAGLRRHHLVHHHDESVNFGVTTRVWDRLLRTAR